MPIHARNDDAERDAVHTLAMLLPSTCESPPTTARVAALAEATAVDTAWLRKRPASELSLDSRAETASPTQLRMRAVYPHDLCEGVASYKMPIALCRAQKLMDAVKNEDVEALCPRRVRSVISHCTGIPEHLIPHALRRAARLHFAVKKRDARFLCPSRALRETQFFFA